MKVIFDAISKYAEAYACLETLQRDEQTHLPIGDQKTGVIAEFYARLYAESIYDRKEVRYGHYSEHVWDIEV